MMRRLVLLSMVLSVGALWAAGPVAAHIAPDPSEAQPGATLTVGFTVEHGCDGSPTVGFEMRLPEGVTGAIPEPADGWDESIDGDVVAYSGGTLAPDVPGTFEITMTLPSTPDTTIYFPFVQRCEVGEIRWIAIPTDPDDELDEPAPAMDLVGAVVTTTAPAAPPAATTAPPADTSTTGTTDAPVATADTTPPDTAPADTAANTSAPVIVDPDDDGDSNTGTIMFVVSVLAVLVVGGLAVTFARRNRASVDTPGDSVA